MEANSSTLYSLDLAELAAHLDFLPPHDPVRFETIDEIDDLNCTNGVRAGFAAEALGAFQRACQMQEDIEVAAGDLIGDLLHLVHSRNCAPKKVLESALVSFVAEAGRRSWI